MSDTSEMSHIVPAILSKAVPSSLFYIISLLSRNVVKNYQEFE